MARQLVSRRVTRLEYIHADQEIDEETGEEITRVHDFGPGVEMWALDDGSVLLRHRNPRKRLWDDFPAPEEGE